MLDTLRKKMKESGIDWFVVFSEDEHLSEYTAKSDRYRQALCPFSGSAGVLVIGTDEALLWTDSRYYIQAADELKGSGIKLMKAGMPSVVSWETYLADKTKDGGVIASDLRTVSSSVITALDKKLSDKAKINDAHLLLKETVNTLPQRTFNPVKVCPVSFCGTDCRTKIGMVRKKLGSISKGVPDITYIVSDLTSIMWLFDLRGSDIEHVPVAYSFAVINRSGALLYAAMDSLTKEARDMLYENDIEVRQYDRFYDDLAGIKGPVFADKKRNSRAVLERFEKAGTLTGVNDDTIIEKHIKCAEEINGMKSSHIKDAVVMTSFIRTLKDGSIRQKIKTSGSTGQKKKTDGSINDGNCGEVADEYSIASVLDKARRENGCSDLSFETICAYKENSAIVHYSPQKDTAAPIGDDGFLLIDSGGQYENEGTTDITRTVAMGDVTDEERKVYTTVLIANLRLMDMVFPEGSRGVLLDSAAESVLWENGYYCGHGIGHGVGAYLSVHESGARISRIPGADEPGFVPGVIVSNEPGVYLEGKFGVRLENLLLTVPAPEAGGHKMCRFEPLTYVPFDKSAIDFTLMNEKEKSMLLKYNRLIEEKVAPLLDDDTRKWLKAEITYD